MDEQEKEKIRADQQDPFDLLSASVTLCAKKERKQFPEDFSFSYSEVLHKGADYRDPAVLKSPEEAEYEIFEEISQKVDQNTEEIRRETDETEDPGTCDTEYGEDAAGISESPSQSDCGGEQAAEGLQNADLDGFFQNCGDARDGGEPEDWGDDACFEEESINFSPEFEALEEEPDVEPLFSAVFEGEDEPEEDVSEEDDSEEALFEGEDEEEDEEFSRMMIAEMMAEESEPDDAPEESEPELSEEIPEELDRAEVAEESEEKVTDSFRAEEERLFTEPETPRQEEEEIQDPAEDTECDVVATPSCDVSITRWDRMHLKETAESERKATYETEHFFAVSEEYMRLNENVSEDESLRVSAEETRLMERLKELQNPKKNAPESFSETTDNEDDEDIDYDDIFNDDKATYRRKKRKKNLLKSILKEIGSFFLILFCAIFLAVNFTIFINRQNTVYGSSMEPTLYEGDRVYTTLIPYVFGNPKIGDIVVLNKTMLHQDMTYFHMVSEALQNNRITYLFHKNTDQTDTYWIKRVVGVAGDQIEFRDDGFYRNGELVTESYIKDQTVLYYSQTDEPIVVPEDYVFVMGDNRNISRDSRAIGCVPVDHLIGKMWHKS